LPHGAAISSAQYSADVIAIWSTFDAAVGAAYNDSVVSANVSAINAA
jgi:hypothetical protein